MPFIPGSPGAGSGTVNSGTAHALAYYPAGGDGTTVDDLPAVPTSGRYLKGNGTDWATSSGSASGTGSCTNQAVTATNSDAAPTCTTLTSAYVNSSIAQTGVDINTSHQVISAAGAFNFAGTLSPTALSGNVNDYNPASLSTALALRIDGGAADRNITGLAGGADGRIITVTNIGSSNNLVLTNQDSSSSTANRFLLSANITLAPNTSIALRYDNTTQRWRPWSTGTIAGIPAAANPTGTVSSSAVNGSASTYMRSDAAPALASKYTKRTCMVVIGDPDNSSPVLLDGNDSPVACSNEFGADWTITSVSCYSNAGTPTVTPILTGGSATSVLTGALTCGTASWASGTVNGSPVVHSFSGSGSTCSSTPCSLDVNMTSAGGTSRYVVIRITGSL